MHTRILSPAAFWSVAAAILLAPPSAGAQQADIAAGAKVYGENCGRCHNPRAPTERTDREWTVIVNHMRVRGGLTGNQARQVLAFLREMNRLPSLASLAEAVPAAPGPVQSLPPALGASSADGPALIESKGCLGCHVLGKAGGNLGPSLNGVMGRRGVEFVEKKLRNPAFNNSNTLMPNLGLTDAEIEAIVEYLKTVQE